MKPLFWQADTLDQLKGFPRDVQKAIGTALMAAQVGVKSPAAKPLKGFRGASVLEVVEHHDGNTYRAVYTVRFAGTVYVLHVFQKKAKRKIATPKHELDLIRTRLKAAREHHHTQN